MKKSKILMPLTGIAAIGAVAPVIAMTSCGNKNTYKLVESFEIENDGLIGKDEIAGQSELTFDVSGKMTHAFETGHCITASYEAVDKTNRVLYVDKFVETQVPAGEAGSKEFKFEDFPVQVNTDTALKDETLVLPITLKEYEGTKFEQGKLLGTQVVEFKFQVFKDKVSCPVVDGTELFTGSVKLAEVQNKFSLEGLSLDKAPLAGLKISLVSDQLKLTNDTHQLEIDKDTTPSTTAVNFQAKILNKDGTQPTATAANVTFVIDKDLTVQLTDTEGKYVKSSWTQQVVTKQQIVVQITE